MACRAGGAARLSGAVGGRRVAAAAAPARATGAALRVGGAARGRAHPRRRGGAAPRGGRRRLPARTRVAQLEGLRHAVRRRARPQAVVLRHAAVSAHRAVRLRRGHHRDLRVCRPLAGGDARLGAAERADAARRLLPARVAHAAPPRLGREVQRHLPPLRAAAARLLRALRRAVVRVRLRVRVSPNPNPNPNQARCGLSSTPTLSSASPSSAAASAPTRPARQTPRTPSTTSTTSAPRS